MSEEFDARNWCLEDDDYWNVARMFANVSNHTYGPYKDWDEDNINMAVDFLRVAINDMIGHRITYREQKDNRIKELQSMVNELGHYFKQHGSEYYDGDKLIAIANKEV